jgi:hypothetical protein
MRNNEKDKGAPVRTSFHVPLVSLDFERSCAIPLHSVPI